MKKVIKILVFANILAVVILVYVKVSDGIREKRELEFEKEKAVSVGASWNGLGADRTRRLNMIFEKSREKKSLSSEEVQFLVSIVAEQSTSSIEVEAAGVNAAKALMSLAIAPGSDSLRSAIQRSVPTFQSQKLMQSEDYRIALASLIAMKPSSEFSRLAEQLKQDTSPIVRSMLK